jgi:hypothetical protein
MKRLAYSNQPFLFIQISSIRKSTKRTKRWVVWPAAAANSELRFLNFWIPKLGRAKNFLGAQISVFGILEFAAALFAVQLT